jgi:sphingolipid delta-4 desaturase
MNRWIALNWVVEVAFLGALVHFAGWGAFGYLAACTVFSIGLHPLGARWIQEHYVFAPNQETYSYYGPLNKIAFNVGYHNEHHDFMSIPWNNLPKLRALAPEAYDTLYWHKSWTGLLFKFLFDPKMTLSSRVFRDEAGRKLVEAQNGLGLEEAVHAGSSPAGITVAATTLSSRPELVN